MISLTVGYVSGIIAAAIHIVQFFIPDAVALIIAGVTRDEQSAITWSVVGQALQNSHWPAILRSDASSTGKGIRKSVRLAALMRPLALLIVTIAAVVTPLGLYQAIAPSNEPSSVPFHYVKDTSPMGRGTPKRPSLGFSRNCGTLLPEACPGSYVPITYSTNETSASADLPLGYDTNVPGNITSFFQSGLQDQPSSVSSVFDIQWRSYTTTIDQRYNNGTRYVLGTFRQLMSHVLDDAIEPIEGLIMDTQSGGIGFRNHTIPSGLEHGATWSEDLLFVEPETQCVNTNLSLSFYIPETASDADLSKTLVLIDRGGFANLNHTYPYYNRTDSQQDPDLLGRAYKAAWLNNAWTMMYMNVTRPNPNAFAYLDSFVGKRFPIAQGFTSISYNSLQITDRYGNYLNLPSSSMNGSLMPSFTGKDDSVFSNPFNVTTSNFSEISTICQGAGGEDFANVSNIAVSCGLLQGAAELLNGDSPLIFDRGSNWTIPLYSCASATKALIKKVDFSYNGTDGLKGLTVNGVSAKTYDKESDRPLWAVENTEASLSGLVPLWGLVPDNVEHREGMAYIKREYLYLPGYVSGEMTDISYQNLAGVDFYRGALGSAYAVKSGAGVGDRQDYSGSSDFAMFALWQELSKAPTTAAKIINLIWTDISANAVVGTRSWLTRKPTSVGSDPESDSKTNSRDELHSAKRGVINFIKRATDAAVVEDGSKASVPVTIYNNRIRYHWYFAIPAFLACVVAGLLFVCALLMLVFGRVRRLRLYMFQLSAGRLLGNFIYPDECHPLVPTAIWRKSVGTKRVKVGVHTPEARDAALFAKYKRQPVVSTQHEPLMGDHGDGKDDIQVITKPVRDEVSPAPGSRGYRHVAEDYRTDS